MPEGPEIRRAADRLDAYVTGKPLIELELPDWVDADSTALRDSGITAVRTHGKLMWVEFGTGHALTIHLQLYGRWRFGRVEPAMSRSRRAAFVGPQGGGWLYSATDVYLLPPGVSPERPRGLDPLHPETTAATLATRLLASPRRQIGSQLLDQNVVAGIGNYLRCDALFLAGVAPERRAIDLSESRLNALAEALLRLSRRSLATTGITINSELFADERAARIPRRFARHYVYGRAGHPCRSCGRPITRETIAARPFYACRHCQR